MRILGIDPGIATTGYGILDFDNNKFRPVDYGAILTTAHTPTELRLADIYKAIGLLIDQFHPDALAIEELFFNTNVSTAITVAHARGVILLAATHKGIPISEYTPLQVKQAITGYGRATKQQMQTMVKVMLGLNAVPKPDDTADALAIAICHAHSAQFNKYNLF